MTYFILFGAVCVFAYLSTRFWQNHESHLANKPKPQPFFELSNPSHILCSDKPPLLGGILKPIARSAFEEQENITWTNSPVAYNTTLRHLALVPDPHDKNLVDEFTHFAICDIDPKIGKGVFATKPLKAGTVIGIYTGILNLHQGRYAGKYELNASVHPDKIFCYDAERYRNVTSYIQHAPSEGPHDIATANLIMQNVIQGGVPVAIYVAKRDIEPYEQLLVNYGKTYWVGRTYQLFDQTGQSLKN